MNRKYSCIVLDDDSIYLEIMESLIKKIDFLELQGSYSNPIQAVVDIEKGLHPDILFTDVEMPNLNAFGVIDALDPLPIIIIVSSHWQYEGKLIEKGAKKFISKPIKSEAQLASICREAIED